MWVKQLVQYLLCSSTFLPGNYVFYKAAKWDSYTGAKQVGSGLEVLSKMCRMVNHDQLQD